MKKVLTSGLIAGIILSIVSYGGLYLAVKWFPQFFLSYNSPLFTSDDGRNLLFYSHAFIISLALSAVWERFKPLFKGGSILRGIEFGFMYALVALLPVMWITFSAMDVTFEMVGSWFVYGLFQSLIAGIIFAKINP